MSRGTAYYDLPNGERIELPTTMPEALAAAASLNGQVDALFLESFEGIPDENGAPLDGTDVVKMYLDSLPGKAVTKDGLQLDRIRLVNPLPASRHGIREVQPLGAVTR